MSQTVSQTVSQTTDSDALPEDLIRFPGGLLGFPAFVEYRLAEGPGQGLFWLIAEGEGPTFLLSDPFRHFEGYALELTPAQATRIEADERDEVAVLAITVPQDEGPWTANLQGPIVVNATKRIGSQLVLPGSDRGVRAPFVPNLAPLLQSA